MGIDLADSLSKAELFTLLARHQSRDYGAVEPRLKELNDAGIESDSQVVSCYRIPAGMWVIIVTDLDRHRTLAYLATE